MFNNTTFVNRRTLGKDALVPASRPRNPDPRLLQLVAEQAVRVAAAGPSAGRRWLLVDLTGQRLALVETGRVTGLWPVSTAVWV